MNVRRTAAIVANCVLWLSAVEAISQERQTANEENRSTLPAYIEQVRMTQVGSDEVIGVVRRPLFSYADSVRRIADGGIWAWGESGRPAAMAKCWMNPTGVQTCALTLTSEERVIARGPPGRDWRPDAIQFPPTALKGGPRPGEDEAARLRQLKQQSRRFTAHEFWDPDNSRFELRLLVQPVHRYQDDTRKILDGAVFVLAFDNNPQILLLLEMLEAPREQEPRWQYLLARVSSAELYVLLDGQEVWSVRRTPGIIGKPADVYWQMLTMPGELGNSAGLPP